jgi:hypothetical protein
MAEEMQEVVGPGERLIGVSQVFSHLRCRQF